MGETAFRKKGIGTAQKERTRSTLACGSKTEFYRGVLSVLLKVMERATLRVGFWWWS